MKFRLPVRFSPCPPANHLAHESASFRFVHALALLLLVVVPLVGCGSEPAEQGAMAVSLVTHWSDAEVVDAVPASDPGSPSQVRFDEDPSAIASWKVIQDVEGLRVEDGALRGTTTSKAGIFLLEFNEPQGGGDELWAIEVRLSASAGSSLGLHPLAEEMPDLPPDMPPPIGGLIATAGDWPIKIPLQAGTSAVTVTVKMSDVFSLGFPLQLHDTRRLLIHPTNEAGAEFSIESVRFVFRGEHFASIDSGPGWQGLGEVYRETVITRTPEEIRFAVDLPSRPWLHLAVGSIEDTPPSFKVAVSEGGGEPVEVGTWSPAEADVWSAHRVDLGRWAGRRVELRLHAESDSPGALAFWGGPTVRQASPDMGEKPQTVVLFLADTLRRDHLEAYGYDRDTAPTAARLASEGLRFDNAVSQATWTKASVPAILTGLYPTSLGIRTVRDRVSAGETTLAESFRNAGYATFATSSIPFTGQLSNMHQGVELMYESTALEVAPGSEFHAKTAAPWVDRFLEFLDLHADVPVFAVIHVMDPHSPFRPRPPWDAEWAGDDAVERFEAMKAQLLPHIKHPGGKFFLAPEGAEVDASGVDRDEFVGLEKAWYDGSIRAMDEQLNRVVESLGTHGLADRSLLAFVSDHGEEFLEHGRHFHGTTVYGELNRVPMFLWGRGVPHAEVDEVVQTIDLAPTLLSAAGLDVPERTQGRNLLPLLGEGGGRAVPVFTERHAQNTALEVVPWSSFSIISGPWKLVRNDPVHGPLDEGMGELELFSWKDDPYDQNDLAAENPEVVEKLSAELERWRSWAEAQQLDDADVAESMSAEELEQLRSLGYID